MNLILKADICELENVKDRDLESVLESAHEYIREEVMYYQARYLMNLIDYCNTPNLFAPIV
jgi:hypothetical protein